MPLTRTARTGDSSWPRRRRWSAGGLTPEDLPRPTGSRLHAPGGRGRLLLGDRQGVAVRVLEPRDAAAAGSGPDPVLVLVDAVETLEHHAPAGQRGEGRHDIRDQPTERGVRRDGHLGDLRYAQRRAVRVEHQREPVVAGELETDHVLIEGAGPRNVSRRHERDELSGFEHYLPPAVVGVRSSHGPPARSPSRGRAIEQWYEDRSDRRAEAVGEDVDESN